jgi:nicotinate-nucleotide pyrophosphorylase (carboxylating)
VETLGELQQALAAAADIVLLDNFTPEHLVEAVAITRGRAKLEASGGITLDNIRRIAATGVDYISVGSITKDLRSVDLSMRFEE